MLRLLSLREVAELMDVSVRTVKRRIKEAGIELPRPGRVVKLTENDYKNLIEATRCRSTSSRQDAEREIVITSPVVQLVVSSASTTHTRRTSGLLEDERKLWKKQAKLQAQEDEQYPLKRAVGQTIH